MGGRERRCSHKNYVIIGMMKVSRQYKKILPYRQNFFNAKGGVICEADHEMEENADSIVWHERKNLYRAFPARFFGSCSTAFYTADLYSSFSTAWDDDARNMPNQNSAVLLIVMRRTFPFEPIEPENLFRW